MSRPDTDMLSVLSAELSQRLKELMDQALLRFIQPNFASQFARHAPELAKFRETIAHIDSKDDIEFLRSFRESVPTTDYEPYRPYIAKFFATDCNESDHDIWQTSKDLSNISAFSSHVASPPVSVTSPFRWQRLITILFRSLAGPKDVLRGRSKLQDVADLLGKQLDLWIPGKTDPYAISLVKSYRAFFILNALFALADRQVTTVRFLFASVFVNFLQDYPRPGKYGPSARTLEKHFTPNPLRAAELREIGPPGIQGWAICVWPDLKKFIGITGGPAAASVPKVTHVLGPSVVMQSPCYASSECYIAVPYFNGDPNTDFKVVPVDAVTEYLDVNSDEPSERVLSAWELVTGGHYEPVLTTRNGLWRYRLGDVITVKGFAPDDGLPVINYLHRRNGSLGLAYGSTCTESQLTDAIVSASKRWIGQIIDFTVVADDRDTPVTYGYLVEIGGEIGKDAKMATHQTFEDLMKNNEFRVAFWQGRARKATIRLVEKGTFKEYRRQKCEKANISMGQVKVPIVLSDLSFKEWLLQKVIVEL
ncbi:GH3 auxin-responsive promoter-domain-containing protein [Suillus spraguei]|nr:GH3 auxin-responsive promoter-domain-containing protein [Suillus spraguei]